jgi:hypothetical protein
VLGISSHIDETLVFALAGITAIQVTHIVNINAWRNTPRVPALTLNADFPVFGGNVA